MRTRTSVRRSRLRRESIRILHARPSATLQELAHALGASPSRASAILVGGLPDFRAEHGLVSLGIVREVRSRVGIEFELTEIGRAEAEILATAAEAGRLL